MSRSQALIICGIVAIGGCKSVNTVEPAEKETHVTPVVDKRVITDYHLNHNACVVAIRRGVASGNLLRIDVDVLNTQFGQESFNYKFEWYDENGLLIENGSTHWHPQIIEGKETVTLVGIAPSPQAKDWRLKFQDSRS